MHDRSLSWLVTYLDWVIFMQMYHRHIIQVNLISVKDTNIVSLKL
jgi:hypothetical protein